MKASKSSVVHSQNKKRAKWTSAEAQSLSDILQQHKNWTWKKVSDELSQRYPPGKTAKQCREWERNYLSGSPFRFDWTIQEEVLLLVLRRIYGNHWSLISSFYKNHSDLAVKGKLHCTARKVFKAYKKGIVREKVAADAARLFVAFSAVEILKTEYLPEVLAGPHQGIPNKNKKEVILINILKDCQATVESLNGYQSKLIQNFQEEHKSQHLPISVILDVPALGLTQKQVEDIKTASAEYNTLPLSNAVIVILKDNRVPLNIRLSPFQNVQMPKQAIPLQSFPFYMPFVSPYPIIGYSQLYSPLSMPSPFNWNMQLAASNLQGQISPEPSAKKKKY
jgi:hypothetical protein